MACDMPGPRRPPSRDNCQKRFLWTDKEVDLAPHPVVGLVLQVGDVEKFLQAFGFQSLDLFFRVSRQGPCFTAIHEDGGGTRLVELEELACEAESCTARTCLVLAIAAVTVVNPDADFC